MVLLQGSTLRVPPCWRALSIVRLWGRRPQAGLIELRRGRGQPSLGRRLAAAATGARTRAQGERSSVGAAPPIFVRLPQSRRGRQGQETLTVGHDPFHCGFRRVAVVAGKKEAPRHGPRRRRGRSAVQKGRLRAGRGGLGREAGALASCQGRTIKVNKAIAGCREGGQRCSAAQCNVAG